MVNVEAQQGAGMSVPTPSTLRVLVVHSAHARSVHSVPLTLPAGATVADALQASGLGDALRADLDAGVLTVGVWTRPKPMDTVLRDQDRVEVWRALKVDPKEARRQRYRRQPGTKAAR